MIESQTAESKTAHILLRKILSPVRALNGWSTGRAFGGLVVAAIVVAALLRVVVVIVKFGWGALPEFGDGTAYIATARALRETGSIVSHHFPLGYPVFVAVAGSVEMVRVLQIVCGVLTVICIGRIAYSLYGRAVCVVAMWAMGLYPGLLYMTGRIMSETLFMFLLSLSLMLWLEWDRSRKYGWSLAAASVFGTACIVRSNLLLLTAWIPFWIMRGSPWVRGLRASLLPSIVLAAIVLLPGLYFLKSQGQFMPFATNSGSTFYGANNRLAQGGWVSTIKHPELLEDLPPGAHDPGPAYSRALHGLGLKWIRENPTGFLALLPRKIANAWVPGMQISTVTSQNQSLAIVNGMSFGFVAVVGLLGVFWARPRQLRDGLLRAVLIVYTLMSLVYYGNPRLGIHCVPILIVYSSGMIVWLAETRGGSFVERLPVPQTPRQRLPRVRRRTSA